MTVHSPTPGSDMVPLGHGVEALMLQKWFSGQMSHCSDPDCDANVPGPQGVHSHPAGAIVLTMVWNPGLHEHRCNDTLKDASAGQPHTASDVLVHALMVTIPAGHPVQERQMASLVEVHGDA